MVRRYLYIASLLALVPACSSSDSNPAPAGGGGSGGTTQDASPDTSADATPDNGNVPEAGVDCTGKADGTDCGNGICLANKCAASTCGDKYVDTALGEQCDDGNAATGDGCNSCMFECNAATDCNDNNDCTTDDCATVTLGKSCSNTAKPDATSCVPQGGGSGTCKAGTCAKAGCGNSTVDSGEECDDGNTNNSDGCKTDCTFSCKANTDCDDGIPCNGTETCDGAHKCATGTAVSCPKTGLCTVDGVCDNANGQCAYPDQDKDGVTCVTDCNDLDKVIYPGAMECDDGKDNDCDGTAQDTEACACWVDFDGDGYAATGAAFIPGTSCGAGYTGTDPEIRADCFDDVEGANVHPYVTAWFADYYCKMYKGGTNICLTKSWDYDCNGIEEQRYTKMNTKACSTATTLVGCVGLPGWTGATPPACGASATYRTCTWSNNACMGTDAPKTQECR